MSGIRQKMDKHIPFWKRELKWSEQAALVMRMQTKLDFFCTCETFVIRNLDFQLQNFDIHPGGRWTKIFLFGSEKSSGAVYEVMRMQTKLDKSFCSYETFGIKTFYSFINDMHSKSQHFLEARSQVEQSAKWYKCRSELGCKIMFLTKYLDQILGLLSLRSAMCCNGKQISAGLQSGIHHHIFLRQNGKQSWWTGMQSNIFHFPCFALNSRTYLRANKMIQWKMYSIAMIWEHLRK